MTGPTSTAVRGNRLSITNAGLSAPHDARVERGTIDPTALHCGLAS
ncbi:hypothetical protein AB0D59_00755 [Streptomyces sp. NPDC048417]